MLFAPNGIRRAGVAGVTSTNVAGVYENRIDSTGSILPSGAALGPSFGGTGSCSGDLGGMHDLKVIVSLAHPVGKFSSEVSADGVCVTGV